MTNFVLVITTQSGASTKLKKPVESCNKTNPTLSQVQLKTQLSTGYLDGTAKHQGSKPAVLYACPCTSTWCCPRGVA